LGQPASVASKSVNLASPCSAMSRSTGSALAAGAADDRERRPAHVGQDQRAVAGHGGHVLSYFGFLVFSQARLLLLR
jgi:hypothetical protein